jgi:hypothetical protein
MTERARFAGPEALLGPIVMTLFCVIGALGLVVVGFAVRAGAVTLTVGPIVVIAGLAAFTIWLGWTVVRDLRRFQTVENRAGDWILRNVLGIAVGAISAGAPRTIADRCRSGWLISGTARKLAMSWLEIESDGRRWHSLRSTPAYQAEARALLDAWQAALRNPDQG